MLKLSEQCAELAGEFKDKPVTLRALVEQLGARAAAFSALIFSIPFILWIAFPGLSLILGVIMCINGIEIALKKGVWIPKRWAQKPFSNEKFTKLLFHSQKWLEKIEKVIRPRLTFLHDHPLFRIASGVMIAITALLLALPYPPGMNFTPAVGIALLAIGQLEDDGVFTLIGYGLFVVNLFLFIALPYWGITLLARYW